MTSKKLLIIHSVGINSYGGREYLKYILNDYANENYPDEFFKPEDLHPLPLTHYKWVKDIMYRSSIEPPKNEYEKLVNFKKDWKK